MLNKNLSKQNKLKVIAKGSSNGIDLNDFCSRKQEKFPFSIQKILDKIPKTDIVVVFIGRIVSSKGINELISAFKNLCTNENNATLLLAGTFEQVRSVENILDSTKKTVASHPKIHHLGWVDQIPALLNFADLLVHPSHREGFPNVLLQAIAANCSIVCSNIPGNVDAVNFGKYARLTKVGDVNSIKENLEKALEEIRKGKFDGSDAKLWLETNFDRSVIHDAIYQEYIRLLNSCKINYPETN